MSELALEELSTIVIGSASLPTERKIDSANFRRVQDITNKPTNRQ